MFGLDDAAVAAILGGMISTAGQLYTNKKNRDAEREANTLNWEIAKQNNATQIEMANTAHQREIRDLRLAGLNPILSAGGNGSSTPTLQTPTLNPVHTNSDMFEGLANSAKGFGQYMNESYKANLAQQKAILEASNLELENQRNTQGLRLLTEKQDAEADFYRSYLEKEAVENFTGMTGVDTSRGKDGSWDNAGFVIHNSGRFDDAVRKEVKALEADQRVRKGKDVLSIFPFLSGGLNSAGRLNSMTRYH